MEQFGVPWPNMLGVVDNVKNYGYQQIDATLLAKILGKSQI
jgi:hypothetical protein